MNENEVLDEFIIPLLSLVFVFIIALIFENIFKNKSWCDD